MENSPSSSVMAHCIFFSFSCLLFSSCQCATFVVDGVRQWSNPTASIGDSIIFKHKDEYSLYIFRTESTFKSCNFTQATQLSDPRTKTYTWRPSRPGLFYFSFYNGTSGPCQNGQKLAIKVIPASSSSAPTSSPSHPPSPSPSPSPSESLPPSLNPPAVLRSPAPPATTIAAPPASGGSPGSGGDIVASSPAYPWPFQPHEKSAAGSPSTAVGAGLATSPVGADDIGGSSTPFIDSNPAVPLPTGEIDSATFRLPTDTTSGSAQGLEAVKLVAGFTISCSVFILLL